MEQQSEQNNQPEKISVGEALRSARERAGLSLNEVADRLKLSLRQLEAIERDDFSALPGATFVRGFVRNYARFLEIDPAVLMEALDGHFPSAANEVANLARNESVMAQSDEQDEERSSNRWLVVSLIGVVVVASAVWVFERRSEPQVDVAPGLGQQTASDMALAASVPRPQTSAPVVPAASSAPVAASAAKAVVASAALAKAAVAAAKPVASATSAKNPSAVKAAPGAGKITVSVSESAWVSIVDAEGNKLVYSIVEPGSAREVSGVAPFKVVVGNAAKATLNYNGQAVDLSAHTHGRTTASLELK